MMRVFPITQSTFYDMNNGQLNTKISLMIMLPTVTPEIVSTFWWHGNHLMLWKSPGGKIKLQVHSIWCFQWWLYMYSARFFELLIIHRAVFFLQCTGYTLLCNQSCIFLGKPNLIGSDRPFEICSNYVKAASFRPHKFLTRQNTIFLLKQLAGYIGLFQEAHVNVLCWDICLW